jgi:acyl-CoA hydrolase
MFAERRLPCDVGFVQVSPPDADGTCSLGIGVDYAADAIASTPVLIAEINQRMPPTRGSVRIPLERFAAVVETDRPLLEIPDHSGGDIEQAIAHNVANLVGDGDTIQMGVGAIPAAVMTQLAGHRHLGLHSGMISHGVLDLIDKGVIDGSRKEIDRGVAVTGAALGSTVLYEGIVEAPIEFRPASYTHAPAVLSKLSSFVAINSAIEVDLTGQVGAEIREGVHVGSIGGQADFSKAASLTGARSIIALRSTWRGESTIKAELDGGTVTTARAEVDFVVTEHGAAELRGCDIDTRARRLIAVAAPEHREGLARSFRDRPDGAR